MIKISKDCDLSKLNTFGISVRAKFLVEVHSEEDVKELLNTPEFKNNEKIFLGGGSNVLFTKDWDGIVVLNRLKGMEIIKEDKDFVFIRSFSGELWHDLVSFAVTQDLWGIENLSLIPGTVGAAPMQNIGAYGTELKNVLENVEALEVATGEKKLFTKEECELGYRDSVFKNKLKGKYFILSLTIKLSREASPNTDYKILKEYLEKNKIKVNHSKEVSEAVSDIRRSKLPDPKIIGNAGSFFKNVFIEKSKLQELLKKYGSMPYFTEVDGSKASVHLKIPAGWLIEQCGPHLGVASWKGYRVGNVGVHEKQALVLVNYGGATGKELQNLADEITASVYDKFGLKLIPEVNLI